MEDGTTLVYTAPITARTAITRLSPAAGSIGGRTMLTIAGTGGVWGGEDGQRGVGNELFFLSMENGFHSLKLGFLRQIMTAWCEKCICTACLMSSTLSGW
eukprot:scaffold19409_cov32-Tisochrysis_lutea.AAC.1